MLVQSVSVFSLAVFLSALLPEIKWMTMMKSAIFNKLQSGFLRGRPFGGLAFLLRRKVLLLSQTDWCCPELQMFSCYD